MTENARASALRELQHQADDALEAMTDAAVSAKKAQAEFAGGLSPQAASDFIKATNAWTAAVRAYDQAQAAMKAIRSRPPSGGD